MAAQMGVLTAEKTVAHWVELTVAYSAVSMVVSKEVRKADLKGDCWAGSSAVSRDEKMVAQTAAPMVANWVVLKAVTKVDWTAPKMAVHSVGDWVGSTVVLTAEMMAEKKVSR